jgi:hypothetical protein
MPRQTATKTYANFSGGLITESNILSHPENAAIDIDNFDIIENGSIQRRPGLKFDTSDEVGIDATNPIAAMATNVYKWKSVNGDPSLNLAVIQRGRTLDFFYLTGDEVSTIPAAVSFDLQVPRRPSASTESLTRSTDVRMISGGGRLYVAGQYIDPFVLTWINTGPEFTIGSIDFNFLHLKIRDFKIAEEGKFSAAGATLDGSARQTYMSGAHFYNLANQGWPTNPNSEPGYIGIVGVPATDEPAMCSNASDPEGGAQLHPPCDYTYSRMGYFPTLSDQFHAYQAGGGTTVSEQLAYSPWLTDNEYTGNTPAGRGHFIREAFSIVRHADGKLGEHAGTTNTTLLEDLEYREIINSPTRPEAVTFYAGRVWYAGLEGGTFTNNIYYSQIVGDDILKASKCYQDADPTAEDINALVASDGGVFNLEEIGKIYRLEPIGASLAVIAENGVWVIAGDGEVSSFSADSFSVRKVTGHGAINSESIIFAKDAIYYWGTAGIYRLSQNDVGFLAATDMTSTTIKSFYQRTSSYSKEIAFSSFDEGSNRVLWFYSDLSADTGFVSDTGDDYSAFPNKAFNKVLYYDVSLNAFGKYTLSIDPEVMVVSAINTDILTSVTILDPTTVEGVQVTAEDLADPMIIHNVATDLTVFVPDRSSLKLMTLVGNPTDGFSYRFSDFTELEDFTDWGKNYDSFLETGFDSLGDVLAKSKKAPILQAHLARTETGFFVNPDDPEDEELLLRNP